MRNVLILIVLVAAGPALADAYRWVDENGVVHYSDRPVEGAERIDLVTQPRSSVPPPVVDSNETPEVVAAAPAVSPPPPAEPEPTRYQRLDIVRPQQGETLWNIGSTLSVSLRLSPELQPGHRLQLTYDGQVRDDAPTESLDFQLSDVFRGEHTMQVAVVDADGNVQIESSLKRFYVQQNIIRR